MNTKINQPDRHQNENSPENIAKHLDHAVSRMDSRTVSALHQARDAALAKQARFNPALALGEGGIYQHLIPHSAYQWAAATLLLAAVLVSTIGYWHHEPAQELSHLDIAILTDDLPMEIFVD